MKYLYNYRKAASKFFGDLEKGNNTDKSKSKLIEAFTNLTSNYVPEEFVSKSYKHQQEPKPENIFKFADEDIPRSAITTKRFYDKLISHLRDYFGDDGKGTMEFLKIRAHLKKQLNEGKKK